MRDAILKVLEQNEGAFVHISAIQGALLDAGHIVGLLELFQCLADLEQEHRVFNLNGRYTIVTHIPTISESEYQQQLLEGAK